MESRSEILDLEICVVGPVVEWIGPNGNKVKKWIGTSMCGDIV